MHDHATTTAASEFSSTYTAGKNTQEAKVTRCSPTPLLNFVSMEIQTCPYKFMLPLFISYALVWVHSYGAFIGLFKLSMVLRLK